MKKNGALKMAILVISILLISLISFIGIYKQEGGSLKNILPEYNLGKELNGTRLISFVVDDSTEEVEVTGTGENFEETKKEKVPVNKEEVLTEANYELAKNIIKTRISKFGFDNYDIRVNKENGAIALEVAENVVIDDFLVYLLSQGTFQMIDTETKEVLLDNSDIQSAQTMYYNATTGATVYLNIIFDEEGKTKLEEISKTYVETEDEEGKKTQKTVTLKIDGDTLTTTYFGNPMTTGELPLTIGTETKSSEMLNEYFKQSEQLAILLSNGVNPIVYTLDTNEYVSPIVDAAMLKNILIVAIVLLGLMEIYLIVRYRMNGLISAIAMIGFIALYLLVIRFTDTLISLESMAAVGIAVIVQLMFLQGVSAKLKSGNEIIDNVVKQELVKNIQLQIPLYIMAIVFVFSSWETIIDFGTSLFWGLIISVIYNVTITRFMFIQKENKKK